MTAPRHGLLLALAALVLAGCQSTPRVPDPVEAATVAEADMAVYSVRPYLDLVGKYTLDGGEKVDYAAWKDNPGDLEALDRQVEMIARISPVSHPDQFPGPEERRAYWINSYNTLVLQAVLEYWPLETVRDVRLSFSSRLVPGKGFFYDRQVVVGGEETNLYMLEKQVLKSQKDPRLHFALNCASESCPVLRPWEWTDEQLDAAARDFIGRPENVRVEDGAVYLSRIFKWYRRDFPDDLLGYLRQYAGDGLGAQLAAAERGGFRVKYLAYDWSLNDGREGSDGQ